MLALNPAQLLSDQDKAKLIYIISIAYYSALVYTILFIILKSY
jgi:hypothetical protein